MNQITHHIYKAGDGRMEKVGELPGSFDVDTPIEDPDDERIKEFIRAVTPEGPIPQYGDYIIVCEQDPTFKSPMPAFLYHVTIAQPKPRVEISSQRKPVIE